MNPLKPLISSNEIAEKIRETADLLNREYKGRELTLILVLKGSICLAADLMRLLSMPFVLEMVSAASYGQRGDTPGKLQLSGIEQLELSGRDILLIDDIYDTGQTLEEIARQLRAKNPRSLKTLTLLCKQKTQKRPDYYLFEIGNQFVVGYGLDYKEHYRGLPGIYIIQA